VDLPVGRLPSCDDRHGFRHSERGHPIDHQHRDHGFSLLRLEPPGPEPVPDDAFVSEHAVLGAGLLVSTRLLAPMTTSDLCDPLYGGVALAPWPEGLWIRGSSPLWRHHDCGEASPDGASASKIALLS
jgi:hypothetical protein